jgi:hypothetical protein
MIGFQILAHRFTLQRIGFICLEETCQCIVEQRKLMQFILIELLLSLLEACQQIDGCKVLLTEREEQLRSSLNANNADDYLKLTRSKFGIGSWQAMLDYAKECTKYVPKVVMTVVDKVTTPKEQEESRRICESLGVTLRVRPFES